MRRRRHLKLSNKKLFTKQHLIIYKIMTFQIITKKIRWLNTSPISTRIFFYTLR